jgi:hypothetical protein
VLECGLGIQNVLGSSWDLILIKNVYCFSRQDHIDTLEDLLKPQHKHLRIIDNAFYTLKAKSSYSGANHCLNLNNNYILAMVVCCISS